MKKELLVASILLLPAFIFISWKAMNEPKKPPGMRFRKVDPIILNDTAAQLMIQVYNGEKIQELDLLCTLGADSIRFIGVYLPNDRNVTINYRGSIPLNK